MLNRISYCAVILSLQVIILGCGSGGITRTDADLAKIAGGALKDVVPVSGSVEVDGEPAAGVNIYLYPEGSANYVLFARTDANGNYCWATYRSCDGIEPGKYILTFKHMPKMTPKGKGDDLLKGQYVDPKKSTFKLTVENGVPQEGVLYELTSGR